MYGSGRQAELVAVHALEFSPPVPARHDKSEIADPRLAGDRPVDLIKDAVAQRRPQPAAAQGGDNQILWRSTSMSARRQACRKLVP